MTSTVGTPTTRIAGGLHVGRYPVVLPKLSDPRLHVSFVTTTLQILGQTVFKFDISIAQILITFSICMSIDIGFNMRKAGVIAWPSSAMPTASGIALIMRVPGTHHGDWWSTRGWWIFAGTAVFAMASKHLIRVNGRHIFNPSNFALVVAFLVLGEFRADPQVLWWGPPTPGLVIAFAVIVAGSVLITRRVGQGPTSVGFWVTFAVMMAIVAASGHTITANWHLGPIGGFAYWQLLMLSPEVLVFTFFMITDPKTTPHGRVGRAVFGVLIGITAGVTLATQPREHGTKVGLLAALVVLCIFTQLIERRCPAAGSPDDRIRPWLKSLLTPEPDRNPIRAVGSVAVIALIAGSTFLLGGRDAASPELSAIERRGEVDLPTTIPRVEVADDPTETASMISVDRAQEMANDLMHNLAIETAAYRDGDADLAASGLSGVRLEQARAAIDAGERTAPEYSITTLTATVVRIEPGPQAPPELALVATGSATTDGQFIPMSHTFVLRDVDGVHLLVSELDQDGTPIGEQLRPSGARPIESAMDITATSADGAPHLQFSEVTAEVGLTNDAEPRRDDTKPMPEGALSVAGGGAVGDYDGDGFIDIFVARAGDHNVLFRNDGTGRFVDVTAIVGLPTESRQASSSAVWADIDGDGHLDLTVLGIGATRSRLYLQRSGSFVDASEDWEMPDLSSADPDFALVGLAVGDYDSDGRLDVLIAGASPYPARDSITAADEDGGPCAPGAQASLKPSPSATIRLLHNTGAGFEDRSSLLSLDSAGLSPSAARFVDLNGDGRLDIALTGSSCTSRFLLNSGTEFTESRLGAAGPAMGIETASALAITDLDGDGRLDLFASGVAYPTKSGDCPLSDPSIGCSGNRALRSLGDGEFEDITEELGVRDGAWAWGTAAVDIDLDGSPDLFQVGGLRSARSLMTEEEEEPFWRRARQQRPRLWWNTGGSQAWPDLSIGAGLPDDVDGRAAIPFDYDGDGLVDVLIVGQGGAPRLFRNTTETSNRGISVVLEGGAEHHTTVGTRLTVESAATEQPQVQVNSADGSFQSGSAAPLTFGLGSSAAADVVTVTWPDGLVERFTNVAAGTTMTVQRGS